MPRRFQIPQAAASSVQPPAELPHTARNTGRPGESPHSAKSWLKSVSRLSTLSEPLKKPSKRCEFARVANLEGERYVVSSVALLHRGGNATAAVVALRDLVGNAMPRGHALHKTSSNVRRLALRNPEGNVRHAGAVTQGATQGLSRYARRRSTQNPGAVSISNTT